ncbi:unnamed protein product [Candidula unifasciata]|uniref:Cytochrome b-245 light chain n=1 Tax=Candidula unifasciata TaxID=100452 RepID=A0A8S3Z4G5_9EUPU|nr:unnamed protein product [Candidula unifasciata]
MGKIEWARWANENAIASSCVVIMGGILAVSGQFELWQVGVYSIIMGVLMILLEYPRGRRQKGTSPERKFQFPLSVVVSKGRLLTRSYLVRFIVYLIISVPCCFILPTLLGAVCYMTTGCIYLAAGISGEEWTPIGREPMQQGPTVFEEIRRPPPRGPVQEGTDTKNKL